MKKQRKRAKREEEVQLPSQRDRFTVERFLGGIGDVVLRQSLVVALSSGYQLDVSALPYDVLPAVLILACYSREYEDVELVDDYEALVAGFRDAISVPGQCAHPDLYMASCISILHDKAQSPSYESFVGMKMDKIYNEMTNVEDEYDYRGW
jgi:hypothetical protein